MGEPTVSVIMGTYCPKADHLKDAVQSMINQTWSDWEFLIYNDGSLADYEALLQQVCAMDWRIHYIKSSVNEGLAHALNACLNRAQGKYIARMDDDDISSPERLKSQVEFLEAHPDVDWVGCQALLFDEQGIWGLASRPEWPDENDYLKYSPFVHPSVMFRRDVLVDAGGYAESVFVARCEDYELFMRLAATGYHGYNLREILFQYREDSCSIYRRPFRYYIYEIIIRVQGFSKMRCLNLKSVPYILKPLLVWLLSCAPALAQNMRKKRSTDNHAFSDVE